MDEYLFSLWAKKKYDQIHPLICHMIDVGNVAEVIWEKVLQQQLKKCLQQSLNFNDGTSKHVIALFASLHDLGKAHNSFQQLNYDRDPHNFITSAAIQEMFSDQQFFKCLSQILGGHHGSFPQSSELNRIQSNLNCDFLDTCRSLKNQLIKIRGITTEQIEHLKICKLNNPAAIILAGLISVSDWIASNEDFFTYENNLQALDQYNIKSRQQAFSAVKDSLHWTQWQPKDSPAAFSLLFPEIIHPRPLQNEVINLTTKLNGPALVIIEAPTGEGKSEAAMFLADYFSSVLKQKGMYFALPSQATSNQMFGRIHRFLSNRYCDTVFNIMLQHGHAALNEEFNQIKICPELFNKPDIYDDQDHNQGDGAVAASWFTHRKRGLLSPFGVGTIDQILMAALQTKHFFVRLYGLACKTIVIDEVHAYDTYMITLLERLLNWLAAMNCSVVMLSATLPRERCQQLFAAYQKGRTGQQNNPPELATYPRISWSCDNSAGSVNFETSDLNQKQYSVKWVDGYLSNDDAKFVLGILLQEKLSAGGCAAIICNTVNRAQSVYLALKKLFSPDEIYLFHARYLFKDRQLREEKVLKWFGKERTDEKNQKIRPFRKILVATQVIEQSLDLDFDLMVTDMAPVDLLIQRAGRLHRHQINIDQRPQGLQKPQLWICKPQEYTNEIPTFDSGTEKIYEDAKHILFRTWLSLKDKDSIDIPDETQELIEAAYDSKQCPEHFNPSVRLFWEKTRQQQCESLKSQQEIAAHKYIKHPTNPGPLYRIAEESLLEEQPELHPAFQAATRLGQPTVEVLFIQKVDDRYFVAYQNTNVQLDFDSLPAGNIVPAILANTVRLPLIIFADRQNFECPTAWRSNALLRYLRVVVPNDLNKNFINPAIELSPDLGVVISWARKEKQV